MNIFKTRKYFCGLQTLLKVETVTRAFQKHNVDRITVASTSPIGQLAIAAPVASQYLQSKQAQCDPAVQGDAELKEKSKV